MFWLKKLARSPGNSCLPNPVLELTDFSLLSWRGKELKVRAPTVLFADWSVPILLFPDWLVIAWESEDKLVARG